MEVQMPTLPPPPYAHEDNINNAISSYWDEMFGRFARNWSARALDYRKDLSKWEPDPIREYIAIGAGN